MEGRNLKSRHAGEHIRKFGGNLDLGRTVGGPGVHVHGFDTLNDDAASHSRGRYGTRTVSGAPWCWEPRSAPPRAAASAGAGALRGALSAAGLGSTGCGRPRRAPFVLRGALVPGAEGEQAVGYKSECGGTCGADFGMRARLPHEAAR